MKDKILDLPKTAKGSVDYNHLFLMWLNSECPSLADFAKKYHLNKAAFKKRSIGWYATRQRLRVPQTTSLPDQKETRYRMIQLWWEIISRIGLCISPGNVATEELKRLTLIASVVKAAQSGISQLQSLDEEDDKKENSTALIIEGLNVEHL